jgi:bifunctional DNA primase/polymerase-like protein/CHC2-type zinc finger protein
MLTGARRPGSGFSAARAYWRSGLNVIPVSGAKKPLVRWGELQSRRVTEEDLREWYATYPGAWVAVICGAISGRVVVDLDPRNADPAWLENLRQVMPPTPTVLTPRGGVHYHFLAPDPPHAKVTSLRPGVDYQGEGACAVLPPTTTADGVYTWVGEWRAQPPLAPIPYFVRHLLREWDRERELEEKRPVERWTGDGGQNIGRRLELDQVLARLRKVRRCRSGWTACCPAHEDRTPSLSITVRDGRVLLHCFADCRFESIVRALGPSA